VSPGVDDEAARELIASARDTVTERIAALSADVTGMVAASRDANADDEHDPEGTTIAFELSQASALLEQSRASLLQIDAALARMDEGTYGICAVCATPVPEDRLEARPWTAYCIAHASGKA